MISLRAFSVMQKRGDQVLGNGGDPVGYTASPDEVVSLSYQWYCCAELFHLMKLSRLVHSQLQLKELTHTLHVHWRKRGSTIFVDPHEASQGSRLALRSFERCSRFT
jgi:hypothetical protein